MAKPCDFCGCGLEIPLEKTQGFFHQFDLENSQPTIGWLLHIHDFIIFGSSYSSSNKFPLMLNTIVPWQLQLHFVFGLVELGIKRCLNGLVILIVGSSMTF
jgi:hypothetical protein